MIQSAAGRARSWVVVGGGMLGLTLALRLAQRGHEVTVLEGAPEIGGLAGAWTLPAGSSVEESGEEIVWDRHYHVTLLSDSLLRGLLGELGLESRMRWVETRTGYHANGRLSSVSSPIEFLKLPSLSPLAKARLGATVLAGTRIRDWRRLERVPVADWLTRWSGRATFERFWLPLLRAKLGESWRDTSAAFIWATIQRLYAARRRGLEKEMFGYVHGGYRTTLQRFAEHLRDGGVELRTGTRVERLERVDGQMHVAIAGDETLIVDDVVVTTDTHIADGMCVGLTDDERARLRNVRYQGIVCASIVLHNPLSPYYLTYLLDDAPFTAVIEMTAFVDRSEVGGHALVYLPKYVASDDPLFEVPDAELEATWLEALARLYPRFRPEDVVGVRVSRVRKVFAIPTLGYSARVPAIDMSVPGLHLVTSAQIVNGTLNVEETVRLAEAVAPRLADGLPALHPDLDAPGDSPTARG